MLLERVTARGLAHYSYLVGDRAAGAAAVVDPRRDVDVYLERAAEAGVSIRHVLETHIHADFASGARELAKRAGAELLLSAHDEGEEYEVAYPHRELREGDVLRVGEIRIRALHTPGHTPEHLSFLVSEGGNGQGDPRALLTGDFLLVGSVGRPDLLGEGVARELAGRLADSVRGKLEGLPDDLEILPAHGAGSMCGSGIGGRASSTLGRERVTNPYLDRGLSREGFVDRLLSRLPPVPDYYPRMKRLNADGPPILGPLTRPEPLSPAAFRARQGEEGAVAVDLRDPESFGRGHVPGAFGIGVGPSLSVWASWLVPYEVPLLLVGEDPPQAEEAVRYLVRVGLEPVEGFLDGGMVAWREAGLPVRETPQLDARRVADRRRTDEELQILDVRSEAEWEAGHVPEALHVPGEFISDHLDRLAGDGRELAVMCETGYRSTAVASVLERAGVGPVANVTGGMSAWRRAGLPVRAP